MKRVVIVGKGGPEQLQVQEAPETEPQHGEARIRVRASGINFADILARKGLYPDAPRLPAVVGYEVSGVVDRVGSGVDVALVGAEVVALTRFGGYADVISVPAGQVFQKPAALSHEQAASVPVAYLTAWQLLVVMGSLKPGETVLIHNAGGGVGLAAIDIANHIGATIYGTASTAKHGFLLERGVHEAIDYRTTDWAVQVDRLTGGRGVSLIIDPLGGKNARKSYHALRSGGRLGMFGISAATASRLPGPLGLAPAALGMPFFHPVSLMNTNRSVFGVNLGHMWHETGMIADWMRVLLAGVGEGWVRAHVDRTFPLEEAGAAHTYIEERRNTGKVVLTA
jgi:NADPH:quinone reductase-like Zn-dependent oxidoreductase